MQELHIVLPPHFRFLDLPVELRDIIYDLCLVRGKVFLRPRPDYDLRYSDYKIFLKPEWQLLQVSHRVRNEAAKVLLSKNHFVVSNDSTFQYYFYSNRLQIKAHYSLKNLTRRYLRSVSITMDSRNLVCDGLEFAEALRERIDSDGKTGDERVLSAHADCGRFSTLWLEQCRAFSRVKFLQIDIISCYCPLGCHRMIEEVAEAISYAFWDAIPRIVEICGTKSTNERNMILIDVKKTLQQLGHKDQTGVLRFKAIRLDQDDEEYMELHDYDIEESLEDEQIDIDTLKNRNISLE